MEDYMATVYKRKDSKHWYAHFIVRRKRYRIKTEATNKAQAKILARQLEEDAINRRYNLIDNRQDITLMAFSEEYIEFAKERKRSWNRDVVSLKNILNMEIDNKKLGDYLLEEIESHHVAKYQNRRKKELDDKFDKKGIDIEKRNYATINREIACLRHIFNIAIEEKKITANPVQGHLITKFHEQNRNRILDKDEIYKLLSVCDRYIYTIVCIALNTGMRLGEILTLHWSRIDLDDRKIFIPYTKTGKERYVPINTFLWSLFMQLEKNNDYLFLNKSNKPIKSIKTAFNNCLKKAGILGFRFHDLRHTSASYMSMEGVDETTIAEILGHAKSTITSRYSHSSWERKAKAVEKLGEFCHSVVTKQNIHQNDHYSNVINFK
jgi:integrase